MRAEGRRECSLLFSLLSSLLFASLRLSRYGNGVRSESDLPRHWRPSTNHRLEQKDTLRDKSARTQHEMATHSSSNTSGHPSKTVKNPYDFPKTNSPTRNNSALFAEWQGGNETAALSLVMKSTMSLHGYEKPQTSLVQFIFTLIISLIDVYTTVERRYTRSCDCVTYSTPG